MIFTCCHPALSLEARLALTLRTLGGLDVVQLAQAFLTTETAMYQRLVRAKRKVVTAGIPYRVPSADQLPERLAGVRHVVYVMATEGHTASSGDALVHEGLTDEAIRLARLLTELIPDDAETLGLLALLLLTDARRPARTDDAGDPVSLEDQDRSRWDRALVAEGIATLEWALSLGDPGPFQVQAAVAALHAEAPSYAGTDWPQVAELYAELERHDPSPVVRVHRAAAVGVEGPAAGLALLEAVDDDRMARYQPYWAVRAELLARTGAPPADTREAYRRALALTANDRQRAALAARAARLTGEEPAQPET